MSLPEPTNPVAVELRMQHEVLLRVKECADKARIKCASIEAREALAIFAAELQVSLANAKVTYEIANGVAK